MNKIQAVLFDYGGLLADEGFSNVLEALAKEQHLAVENMTYEGMQSVYDSGFVLGKGSESDFWALLRERTGLHGADADHRARIEVDELCEKLQIKLPRGRYVTLAGLILDKTHTVPEKGAVIKEKGISLVVHHSTGRF